MRPTTLIALALCGLAAVASAQQDEIYLEITQPGLRRVAVAAPPLMVLPGTPAEVARGFQETLDEDLAAAAPIAVVDRRLHSLVEDDPRPEVVNERWRSIGAQFLLSGTVVRAGGQLVVEARLIDLVSGELAFAKRYRAGISAAEIVAHTLANDLVQVFTGRPGPFLSRIAFISDRTGSSELWVMDWNGLNQKQLTKHEALALGPTWSPDGTHLVFTSYLRGTPALYLLTPQEGYLKLLHDAGGVNSSPSVSPDGRTVAFASSLDGNVDVYTIPLEGGRAERLTTALGIDTQPAWAPNGRQIAFTSTRSGSPQLYLMDADGSNVRRVSFGGQFHDEPSWAPDGTRIACTTRDEGTFQIATIDAVTTVRTVISAPGNNESPCFSPEGSMIAFESDRTGRPQIYITDSEGVPRQLTTQGSNHSPTWIGAAE
ncbi:MAG TPA: Tol-Pal system beta propeller repeat protein TolB [Candidatus Sulfomarinibacteraceae bacterium]|nr:Tol-Pal system beta propeller repeat protein TolB [Candidatus Sulfomarinibacteraceae bacterium]